MLIPNHPDPERLSALASGDTDATADAALSDHVSTCAHCTALVEELGALRMSLAELPDLRPHRPLRLLPVIVDKPSRVDRLGGWARRFFAPVLTAGAALALVGLIGTATPALDNLSAGAGAESGTDEREAAVEPDAAQPGASSPAEPHALDDAGEGGAQTAMPLQSTDGEGVTAAEERGDADGERLSLDERQSLETAAERSPWPMVLFSGVALMVAAGLLRWILAPRAP